MENEQPYSIYDHLRAHDVISQLKPLLDGGGYQMRLVDGKIEIKNPQMARETPWVHVKHEPGFNCGLWHQIIFDLVSMRLPEKERFVPRHCQNCWKVVVKPRTLKQLFNLLEIQKRLDRPAKCGIEPRKSVHGLYGGYFYNKGQDRGLECYQVVYQALKENDATKPLLDEIDDAGKTTRIILKRGCTEFEHAVGPSDQWAITDEQNVVEDLIERYMVVDEMNLRQPDHLIWSIKRRWIEFAWENGDPTYALYTGGKPIYPPYVTYHPPIETQVPARVKKPRRGKNAD